MNTSIFKKAIVEVDAATLERSAHGSITGIITVRIDDGAFPDARWSDFPVVLLGCWLEPVSRVLHGKTRVWDCRFMDGPISVRLEQQHDDAWTLIGLRDNRVEFTATVSCHAFIHSLVDAAQQILQECRRRGWQSRDIEKLESAIRMTTHAG